MDLRDFLAGPGLPVWDPEADEMLVCRRVIRETHDVATFVLGTPEPRLFRFLPGQFLTFELEIGGQVINRCYTIASSPARPHLLAITVKRVPGGPVSNWLHDTLRPGMTLRASAPQGVFTCAARPPAPALYLSAGSGITPLMSMARCHDDLATGEDVVFVHSARSPDDIIFRAELALLARGRGFRLALVCEADGANEPWAGHRGRLDLAMLRQIAPDFASRAIYTCGPAPYMAGVRAILAQAGFDMAQYHEESFDFGALAEPEPTVETALTYSIEFTRSRRTIRCGAETNILTAARLAGLRLPSSCTKGVCGTCKSRLVSGAVDMQHGGGIRQREIDAGQILICCARPRGDLVIER